MKPLSIGSTLVLAFALPAEASEFEFRGVTIVGTGYYTTPAEHPEQTVVGFLPPGVEDSFFTGSVGVSGELGIGRNFFVQGDAAFATYDMAWDDFKLYSLGAHFGYQIGHGTNLGAFAVGELWDQDDEGEVIVGAEIAGQTGDFSYEVYGAYVFDPTELDGWNQTHFEAIGGYDIGGGFGVELGAHYTTGDLRFMEGDTIQGLANVNYELANDFEVELGYVYSSMSTDMWDNWGSHGAKLALTKVIGGGTTFDQRNYLSLHNGY